MTKYSSINIVYRLQKWMDSVPGQTFLNYAYSWGASIVILGTLFKLTHLPGADLMLYLGMGTEVFVFFLSAFDRPFDKTTDGMELPTHLHDDEEPEEPESPEETEPVAAAVSSGGQTIIIGGGGGGQVSAGTPSAGVVGESGPVIIGGGGVISGNSGEPAVSGEAGVSGGYVAPVNADMQQATENYVAELQQLTETLAKVSEQSRRLTTDSEEMENLNRTLTGICRVYEMQLKSASQQMGTIDQINEQTNRLAEQITELNAIYTRMIQAMSVKQNL